VNAVVPRRGKAHEGVAMQGALRTGQRPSEVLRAPVDGDGELVAMAQANPQAFEHLYRRYVDAVHRYCYRKLGSREAAEDATSQIFTRAFTALPSFRAGSFRSWLFTIAFHVIADDLRARRPQSELDMASMVADKAPSPEEHAIARDENRFVLALLTRLPESQRRVVELRLAGLSGREIAEVLGRGLPAVKMAQLRAYARLRDLLVVQTQEEEAP
jgi:RNA polymerase sigma-70 factor (ECF subfamily)